MLVLLFILVIFFWLVVGAVQYVLCVAVPRLRRYALSAALWWAVWGPCSVGLMMLAGLALVANAFIAKDHDVSRLHVPNLPVALGWTYLILGAIGTAVVATGIAWLHQALARRFTFALFRLYATVISAGIGSVFGWCFIWCLLATDVRQSWGLGVAGMLLLIVGFGIAAYKNSRALRGDAPTALAWVSREEFEGT